MLIWLVLALVTGEISQSFLQQDDEDNENIILLGEADYDIITYQEEDETEPYVEEDLYPEGESSPENDYLLEKYKNTIEYIYFHRYVVPQNETLGEDVVTVVEGDVITEEEAEASTGEPEDTREDDVIQAAEEI